MSMGMAVLKLKSSAAPGCGESPLKCHRSISLSLAIAMAGFAILRFTAVTGGWVRGSTGVEGLANSLGAMVVLLGLADEDSGVCNSDSTNSIIAVVRG